MRGAFATQINKLKREIQWAEGVEHAPPNELPDGLYLPTGSGEKRVGFIVSERPLNHETTGFQQMLPPAPGSMPFDNLEPGRTLTAPQNFKDITEPKHIWDHDTGDTIGFEDAGHLVETLLHMPIMFEAPKACDVVECLIWKWQLLPVSDT